MQGFYSKILDLQYALPCETPCKSGCDKGDQVTSCLPLKIKIYTKIRIYPGYISSTPINCTNMSFHVSMTPRTKASHPLSLTPTPRPRVRRPLALLPRATYTPTPLTTPDPAKRTTMNLLLAGAVTLPVGAMGAVYLSSLAPPHPLGTGGNAQEPARDAVGNVVRASEWIHTHPAAGDRSLVQGLKGEPTYLVVAEDGMGLENYGLNSICTHLGCVVPWNKSENKFMCPCHGSQYNNQGKVVRGPAPLSLELVHVGVLDDVVTLLPWTETDFRTGEAPWWSV